MVNPTYSYRASDGNTYSGTLDQLRQWSTEGRVRLEDFVTNSQTGHDVILRDLLYPPQSQQQGQATAQPGPTPFAQANPYDTAGAYPRGYQAAPMGMDAPDNIGQFNWGAFFFSWIWGLNHRRPLTLLVIPISCIPLGGLAFSIWIGTQGNLWAWESGRFSTPQECTECQKIWAKWALGVFLVQLALGIVYVIAIIALAASSSGAPVQR